MWYVAITLGFFGSLHCLGMCGPLALAFSHGGKTKGQRFSSALAYNLGRTLTYAVLGLGFGILGTFLFVADLQKVISIVLGAVFILTFLFSVDIDRKINSIPLISKMYQRIHGFISSLYQKSKNYPPFILGMANGILPCGLVYLALAGALASGNVLSGALFMTLFGLGTIPMMIALVLGYDFIPSKTRLSFRKVLPYVTLCFGMFLIYRGVMVEMPRELNFWEALKNPVMCH